MVALPQRLLTSAVLFFGASAVRHRRAAKAPPLSEQEQLLLQSLSPAQHAAPEAEVPVPGWEPLTKPGWEPAELVQVSRSVPDVTILKQAGHALLDASAVGISLSGSTSHWWAEGPVWAPTEKAWFWSDVIGKKQWKYNGTLSVYREDSNWANGNTVDTRGNLLTAEHSRDVSSTNLATGVRTVLVNSYDGKALNSPNDIIVSKSGIVYFTDNDYGSNPLMGPGHWWTQSINRVYRFDPATQELTAIINDMVRPNGLCFSPDESRLYVADSGAGTYTGMWNPFHPHQVNVYDISADGKQATRNRVLMSTTLLEGVPDGIRSDERGNIWVSTMNGVAIYTPNGERIAEINTPRGTANLGFGGESGKQLVMASQNTVWLIETKVTGAVRV